MTPGECRWFPVAAILGMLLVPGCKKGNVAPRPDSIIDSPAVPADSADWQGPPDLLRSSLAAVPLPSLDTTLTVTSDTSRTVALWLDTTLLGDTIRFSRGRTTTKLKTKTTTERITEVTTLVDSTWLVTLGIPYGPYGAVTAPFSVSLNYSDPSTIVTQINTAWSKGQKIVLSMTACCRQEYLNADSNFTLSKWKARQDRFNTVAIKAAIAAGVSNGTVIGDKLLDEPEHGAWGTGLSKSVVDEMAAYTKAIFPTLPVGVSHGPPGYRWRTDQTYKKLDFILPQYNWAIRDETAPSFKSGDVVGWRNRVLAQAALDHVAVGFSMNLLDGGYRVAGCPVPQTGGPGTYSVNCRMIASQIRDYGLALGPFGCVMLMWKYETGFMGKADNQAAFRDVATRLATSPRQPCRRR